MQRESGLDDAVFEKLIAGVEPSRRIEGASYFSVDDVRRIVQEARRPFTAAAGPQLEVAEERLGALADQASEFPADMQVVAVRHVRAIVQAALMAKVAGLEVAAEQLDLLAADCRGHSAYLGSGFSDRELEEISGVHSLITAHAYAVAALAQRLRQAVSAQSPEGPDSQATQPAAE